MFEQEQVASYVSVKLSNNAFNESNYIVRVPRETVSMNGVVSEIVAGYPSLDPYVILHSCELVKAKILELLMQGRSVDVLELGTMYLKPDGTVTRDNPQVTDLPSLSLKFTPSTSAKEAIAAVSANSFMISSSAPEIQTLLDLYTSEEWVATASSSVRVTGSNLKLAIDDEGNFMTDNRVSLVPAQSDGTPDTDTATWVDVTADMIYTNYAKTLELWIPANAQAYTDYFLYVQTTYLSKNEQRKTAVSGYSPQTFRIQ